MASIAVARHLLQPDALCCLLIEYMTSILLACDDLQAGFRASDGSVCSCQRSSACSSSSNTNSHRPACVHLLDANDACWPLVHAARDADQQQADAADASLHPAAALHSQVARAAGDAAAVEPDIVLVGILLMCCTNTRPSHYRCDIAILCISKCREET